MQATATDSSWWVRMADITENTKITVKIASIGGVAILLLTVGMWFGGLANERSANIRQLADHQQRLSSLEERFASVDKTLALIQKGQEQQQEPLANIGRLAQYQVELLRDIETALAKRGIDTEKHGP